MTFSHTGRALTASEPVLCQVCHYIGQVSYYKKPLKNLIGSYNKRLEEFYQR